MSQSEIEVRADPAFKLITSRVAQEADLKVIGAELHQTLTAALVLEIPSEASAKLESSLFSFLIGYQYAIVEFKGQNDPFTLRKFLTNMARTALFCLKREEVEINKVLNLFVCSRYLQEILGLANAVPDRPSFTNSPEQPWLWRASFFFQEVIIVVCRDLPIEPRFYDWLLFAPASTIKWWAFVRTAIQEGRRDLIEILIKLRPREVKDMVIDVNELLSQLDPKERERLNNDWTEVLQEELPRMMVEEPENARKILSRLDLTKMVGFLSSEQVAQLRQLLAAKDQPDSSQGNKGDAN